MSYPIGQPSRKAMDRKFENNIPPAVPDAASQTCSVAILASQGVTRDDFHVPHKSDEISMLPMHKPTTQNSCYRIAYPDFTKEYKMLEELDADRITTAFDSIDTHREGYVLVSELRMLFMALCGAEPTDRQYKVMASYAGRYEGGKLSLMDFVQVISDTADHLQREVYVSRPDVTRKSVTIAGRFREQQDAARRAGVTAATLGLTSDIDNAENVVGFHVHGPSVKSSYQVDIGSGDDIPATRPAHDTVGAGLFSTTRDLAAGTTRQSKHAPGYMGHIPSFTGTHAASQGLGQTKRDTFHSKTNLADTYQRRIPGYGGHAPRFSASSAAQINMFEGQFAPTESLSAPHVIKTYWEAKKSIA